MYVPKGDVVTRQTYEPGNTDIGPQMAKIKASGAEVVAMFTIPAYTALRQLAGSSSTTSRSSSSPTSARTRRR